MSSGISIGSINVGLGDTRNLDSMPSFNSSRIEGGDASLLAAAMGGISLGAGAGLDFSGIGSNELSSMMGASVIASISSGASSRPDTSSFDDMKAVINQIAQGTSSLNSPGSGLAAHEPTRSLQDASALFASLLV